MAESLWAKKFSLVGEIANYSQKSSKNQVFWGCAKINLKGVITLKMKKKDWRQLSELFMSGSLISIILSGLGYLGTDIWLASTQWLLVAATLALFGLYSRMNA